MNEEFEIREIKRELGSIKKMLVNLIGFVDTHFKTFDAHKEPIYPPKGWQAKEWKG